MRRVGDLILNKGRRLSASLQYQRCARESFQEVKRYLAKNPVLPARIRKLGNDIGISAIFKDEGAYIAEWINFHRSVGFTRFFLYDNGSTDEGPTIARECSRNGDVCVIPWNTFTLHFDAQLLAYSHAVCSFGTQCAWMAFIDIDEFLFPLDDVQIGDLLSRYTDVPSVAIPWHMYGTSGHKTPPSGGVLANFVYRAQFPPRRADANLLLKYKTVAQPYFLQAVHPHLPIIHDAPEYFITEAKEQVLRTLRHEPKFARSSAFRLNHYFTKDEQTLTNKSEKGRFSLTRGPHKNELLMERANAIGEGDVYDPTAFYRAGSRILPF